MHKLFQAWLKRFGAYFLFVLLLLCAVFFALTQESGDAPADSKSQTGATGYAVDPQFVPGLDEEDAEEDGVEPLPEWTPPGPPRWFRSNAGGMTLEAIPSRLVAIRNEYALVIDYLNPEELPKQLSAFYQDSFSVEIRVLYHNREESLRQWLFIDEEGNTRLAAVFENALNTKIDAESAEAESQTPPLKSAQTASPEETASALPPASPDGEVAAQTVNQDTPPPKPEIPAGFIEVYNENGQIVREYQYTDAGEETFVEYLYKNGVLIKAESRKKNGSEAEYQRLYTDNYRYNRSASLRSVERVYHTETHAEPVLIAFPGRILDAINDERFILEKTPPASDFLGDSAVETGFRTVFTTDERGRILTQSMLDEEGNEVWGIKNTWSGDRIISAFKTEGDDELLTEYEYDSAGNRILERNLRNGVLERIVRTNGSREEEELYIDGAIVLKALWEDGRKISEERVRQKKMF